MGLSKLIDTIDLDLKDMVRPTGSFIDSIVSKDSLALRDLYLIEELSCIPDVDPCLANAVDLVAD